MVKDFTMIGVTKIHWITIATALFALSVCAQTGAKKGTVKKTAAKTTTTTTATPRPSSTPTTPVNVPTKRNERPDTTENQSDKQTVSGAKTAVVAAPYFYEFTQPKFTITKITITHDEKGNGSLTFHKGEFDDSITEPVQLSGVTLNKISATLAALNFLDSTENYQYEKDYSHLGNIAFRLKKDGREREVHFNYTTNKDAMELANEYRRIGNQIIWIFDMNVSRENQPLDAPRLMDGLESYIQRNEVADASQLVPFLQGLTDDERIPLIARNHAGKLIKQIQKSKK